jgi:(E)-4-hydroxy-3-methyl-but-2-enyl pyrophosphate reductase
MVIRLAKYSGYCFGVRRAIQLALEAKTDANAVYSLGELIHNPTIVDELSKKGIKPASDTQYLKNSTVIIRSHGITKTDYELLLANGNEIIDATCPYVKRAQELIRNSAADGYPVVILGDPNHPEVIGLLSYGDAKTKVVAAGETLPSIAGNRVCLISQTTQKLQNLRNLAYELLPKFTEIRIYNTICLATSQRQFAAIELAKESDLMLIIGGYNSSNTRALASLCEEICLTHHIENDLELEGINFPSFQRIGLSAGASTPETMIVKVFNKIKQKSGESGFAKSIDEIPLFKEESC